MNMFTVILAVIMVVIMNYVYLNHVRSTTNRKLIEKYEKSIEQNKTLISLINALIASSDIKVDWETYAKIAKNYGVTIDDTKRNLDLYDPEG